MNQPLNLATPLTELKLTGVGPKTLEKLQKLAINRASDLLFHLPVRYEDRTHLTPFNKLISGTSAAIVGEIINCKMILHRRPVLQVTLVQNDKILLLYFFNFFKLRLQQRLKKGQRLFCYGTVRWIGNYLGMAHPEFKILALHEEPPLAATLTPIYATTNGLTQRTLRNLIGQVLTLFKPHAQQLELLPQKLLHEIQNSDLFTALQFIHCPPAGMTSAQLLNRQHPMQQRLIFEELLAEQLSLVQLRQTMQQFQAYPLRWNEQLQQRFTQQLPFTLTAAQQQVIAEIASDFLKQQPLLRLVQGDVGCGKTVVAASIMLQAAAAGYQVVLMAPTELLAQQHYQKLLPWFQAFNYRTALITGNLSSKIRQTLQQQIASGEIAVIIGTQALFQEKTIFAKLALVVIDEQHRFGVQQRLQLRNKGTARISGKLFFPHQIIMSATPIPRTLAMTMYAHLDCSTINALPSGRTPIKTVVLDNQRRAEIIARVRQNCLAGHQVYWVCPLIEDSEELPCQAAESSAQMLQQALPELRIALVHGRLANDEKQRIMQCFYNHQIDLLVATTIIEVGVDVPNANLMIIENAERLGLVQLHQLRGRVGRGKDPSFCVLLYQAPLGKFARERLTTIRNTTDGFLLAQKDLELRGAGEILGTEQSGTFKLKIADLFLDQALLPSIQKWSSWILQSHPEIIAPLIARWLSHREQYGQIG